MTEQKQEKPKIPKTTPSGLPRLRSRTALEYSSDNKKLYHTEISYRQELAGKLRAIAEENPRIVNYFLPSKSIDDVLDPNKTPKYAISKLSGAVTVYELLKAQAVKNQEAYPEVDPEIIQPANAENNPFAG